MDVIGYPYLSRNITESPNSNLVRKYYCPKFTPFKSPMAHVTPLLSSSCHNTEVRQKGVVHKDFCVDNKLIVKYWDIILYSFQPNCPPLLCFLLKSALVILLLTHIYSNENIFGKSRHRGPKTKR